ncbi:MULTISPECIES: nucleotidyltransferase family protein [Pseudoalteromonas]|uniref:Mannose-1-phosphate guanylyltransferase n=1 Tax=Pseudoalteromonas amylolytica TaxID=1859457 RepID=A0A1S1MV67_9GAMM|nr:MULTISPECIES: nucleotidyltransferase family protein [Pseudoalteromonas]MCF6434681.1 nucleotidyltransferase family protein [Pseudoalteromonas sp. MMG022]OHU87554.1 mannose-1-phosphate guanylyltransferase [Pseudoalteromonas sp. JW3]OHU90997.1 mannose-1-phosphate guanylyltransferase [Pseudoalteromonas amylolytica]
MKAILLAAGLGTRLRPLTNHIPKCLVPIDGECLLGLWIDKLIHLGVTEILINTHYFSQQVEQYIAKHPHRDLITLVYEPQLLGTGGTLIQNKGFWKDDTCFVIHADNYCHSTLTDMLRAHQHRPKHTDLTLLLFQTEHPSSCGIVKLDKHQVVCEFHEKVANPPGNLASGALFLFSPQVYEKYFRTLSEQKFYDLSSDIVPNMINAMLGWCTDGPYLDIGTMDNYNKAQELHRQSGGT